MRIIALVAAAATVVVLRVGADMARAPEASAVECVQSVTTWQAYNKCAGVPARHWDAIKNSASKYGNWASAGQWSKQSSCWANVVSFGYSLKA
jgi:hypothetical protein